MNKLDKYLNNIEITDELQRFQYKTNFNKNDLNKLIINYIDDFIKYHVNCWFERYKRLQLIRYGFSKYKSFLKYGKEEGEKRWNLYRNKQRITNLYEYKKEKYGWDLNKFHEFNKKRAVTLENLLNKYGKEEGEKRFNSYRQVQSYRGNKKEYFIEKYGKEEGEKYYNKLNKQKILNLDTFIRKYGKEEGTILFNQFINKHTLYFSKSSQKMCWDIFNKIKKYQFKHVHFGELNNEFGKYDPDNKRYYKFDFCIDDIKLIIEYNGDHYHANPAIYKSDDIITKIKGGPKLASNIWHNDKIKYDFIKKMNYNLIIIWESDYLENSEKVDIKILEVIDEIVRNQKLSY